MLGIETLSLHLLSPHSTTELCPQHSMLIFRQGLAKVPGLTLNFASSWLYFLSSKDCGSVCPGLALCSFVSGSQEAASLPLGWGWMLAGCLFCSQFYKTSFSVSSPFSWLIIMANFCWLLISSWASTVPSIPCAWMGEVLVFLHCTCTWAHWGIENSSPHRSPGASFLDPAPGFIPNAAVLNRSFYSVRKCGAIWKHGWNLGVLLEREHLPLWGGPAFLPLNTDILRATLTFLSSRLLGTVSVVSLLVGIYRSDLITLPSTISTPSTGIFIIITIFFLNALKVTSSQEWNQNPKWSNCWVVCFVDGC